MSDSATNGSKRFITVSVWLSLILAALLVTGVWLYTKARPMLLTSQIREAAFVGDYDQARTGLDTLWQLDEASAYDAVLFTAEMADYHGDWDVATELLEEHLGGDETEAYLAFAEEAEVLLNQCAYHQAVDLYQQGAYAKASSAAAAIKDYEPAQMLYQLSYQALLASQPTPEPTPSPTPAPSPETTSEARDNDATVTPAPTPEPTPSPTPAPTVLAQGRIAVGYHHSVFVRDDGTVLAYGDNTYDQTDVGQWRNVVAVAAGAYHTVGLTADGRVLATGDNTYGQTDVSLYTNVRQIAAGAWNTCLLLENGQVMTLGYLPYEFALELIPAQQIVAGSYGLLVRSQGRNIASHPGLAIDDRCEQLSVSRGYAMGVDAQGRVYSSIDLIPTWEDVVQVSAGENAALALSEDGTVLSHVFDRHLKCTFDFGQRVISLCAGANQYAFALSDGSIEIRYADGTIFSPEDTLW